MNTVVIEHALRRLGEILVYPDDIEILLVGGAAGMVTGVLPRSRVTTDCDVMVCVPPTAIVAIEEAAELVAVELQLAPRWLNTDVQIRRDALPDGWERRRIIVGVYQRLYVYSVSRADLIAMKILAGRAQDVEDLRAMRVRADDVAFVHQYLDSLPPNGTRAEEVREARRLLADLEIHEHE